jgi:hypothetical protein
MTSQVAHSCGCGKTGPAAAGPAPDADDWDTPDEGSRGVPRSGAPAGAAAVAAFDSERREKMIRRAPATCSAQ